MFKLAEGVNMYHEAQLKEGMLPLPEVEGALACKYCGGGFGGYALYLFSSKDARDNAVKLHDEMRAVEPYLAVG